MYKCDNCGWKGDWIELKDDRQYDGEYQGQNVYEIYKVCPACGNDEIHYFDYWEI